MLHDWLLQMLPNVMTFSFIMHVTQVDAYSGLFEHPVWTKTYIAVSVLVSLIFGWMILHYHPASNVFPECYSFRASP